MNIKNLIKTLGPGVMFAGTCIGGSHLMQSTKAGAFYGFGLISIVLVANLMKYPFFEFASRYTNATGDSILEGYKRLGKWTLVLFGLVTFFSMFVINAAITALTSGLGNNLFESISGIETTFFINGENLSGVLWAAIISTIVFGILTYGKFSLLDKTLKIVGTVLVLTVFIAFFSVIGQPSKAPSSSVLDIVTTPEGFGFAIVLMGWMPMGVDMSAWHSLWTQERIKQTNYHPTLKETLLDFNFGYLVTVVLALFFLSIGAKTLYHHPDVSVADIKSMGGLSYSKTLVQMFTESVGSWSYYIILLAAFATMFGTAITLGDGYCRSIVRVVDLVRDKKSSNKEFLLWLVILMVGSLIVLYISGNNLSKIVNIATATSFIIAPFAAFLNYKIIFSKNIPESHKPKKWLKHLALFGIAFLTLFTALYILYLFDFFSL